MLDMRLESPSVTENVNKKICDIFRGIECLLGHLFLLAHPVQHEEATAKTVCQQCVDCQHINVNKKFSKADGPAR